MARVCQEPASGRQGIVVPAGQYGTTVAGGWTNDSGHCGQPVPAGRTPQDLQNNALKLTTRLREATDKRRALSRMEIFNEMLEQSEALRKLKEEFELELA